MMMLMYKFKELYHNFDMRMHIELNLSHSRNDYDFINRVFIGKDNVSVTRILNQYILIQIQVFLIR